MQNLFEQETTKSSESCKESTKVEAVKPAVSSLASKLKADIDRYSVESLQEKPRWHLGASVIEHDCKRLLWYGFRWFGFETLNAMQLRLLERGQREEKRFIELLNGIGCQLWACDENGKQFEFSSVMGHFGGSIDAVIQLPESYNFTFPLLAEFKTNGTGKGFNSLCNDGIQKAKPRHWAQACTYGYKLKLDYLAYFNVNKNCDDLHIEVLEIDKKLGKQMEDKAEIIVKSQTAPPKLSDNPNHVHCTLCCFKGVCHNGEQPAKNCRSCKNATPVDNAEWFCSAHSGNIPRDYVSQGCDKYELIG